MDQTKFDLDYYFKIEAGAAMTGGWVIVGEIHNDDVALGRSIFIDVKSPEIVRNINKAIVEAHRVADASGGWDLTANGKGAPER